MVAHTSKAPRWYPAALGRLFDLIEEADEIVSASGLARDDPLRLVLAKLYRERRRVGRLVRAVKPAG